ncbi:MAG: Hpt domain-containing protein, partial [Ekhidna sp.]
VLKASISDENISSLRAYAHKNKSSLSLGGLEGLSKEAEEIEEMIDRDMTKSRILEKALIHQKEVEKVLEELRANE